MSRRFYKKRFCILTLGVFRKMLFDVHDIARSNYIWLERKTRINLALSATILILLAGAITLL